MKIIYRLFTCLIVVFSAVSCSDDFFDVNKSQNGPTSATPELSLPVAQKGSIDLLSGDYNSMNTVGNIWSYTWAAGGDFVYFTDEMKYNITSAFRGNTFNTAYLAPLNNYHVIDKNLEPKYANFRAIAKIMKAFHYQYLVDAYGNIPYSQALEKEKNPKPVYDNAQTVYNDLLVQLTAAQDLIAASASNPLALVPTSEVDVMLGGDMAKWARFANTLKLRILLRQSEIGVTDYSSVNNAIGFLGAGETVFCNPGYVNDTAKQNPLWGAFGQTVAGDPAANANATRATDYVIAKLGVNDPRRARLYRHVGSNVNLFVGIPQNSVGGPTSANLSGIGPGILIGATQNGIIMQSAESLLLQAEAAARGFIPGNAEALYNLAVQESFTQLGAGTAAAYLAGTSPYPNATLSQNVEAIIYQKWVALNGTNGFETWIEYRRTGFPADLPVAQNATSATLPVRLLYPSSEQATNSANVPAQSGADAFNSRVFWDTNN